MIALGRNKVLTEKFVAVSDDAIVLTEKLFAVSDDASVFFVRYCRQLLLMST
jgi:hypothetical protein